MRSSIFIAVAIAVAATAWIASGQFGDTEGNASSRNPQASKKPVDAPLISVRVKAVQAQTRTGYVLLNGRTEESRRVTLRAETRGPIVDVPGEEGHTLEAGDVIARQNVEDRKARMAEAKALVRQREIEYKAAAQLAKKGFRSGTKLAEARANLDAARAKTKGMSIDLSRTTIRAPFRGVLETRDVEKGDFVKAGDKIASFVDLDPILAVGYVSERDVGALGVGRPGRVTMIDGTVIDGTVRYIASVADKKTRSFRVEMQIPNPDHRIRAGLTGELTLPLAEISAHLISPAVLTLADDGRIGVRIVDPLDIVRFVPVKILSNTPDGLWIAGLRNRDRLITVGHEYVKAGQKVRPVSVATVAGS
ncbi:MAG: efflux RND transporter periplasmic adaptor subunit [Pseudomonadota bacterium]|nr:efflux RND transporter periplasmic adaptor subunit [Pseudomonadota bacterium]